MATWHWSVTARVGGALTWQGSTAIPLSIELRHELPGPGDAQFWLGARWLSVSARGNPSAQSLLLFPSRSV